MDYEDILLEEHDGILTIRLNRPERMNAGRGRTNEELVDAFEQADQRDSVRVVVLTAEGRAFCAGADVSGGADTFAGWDEMQRDGGGLITLRMFSCLKPIIAAVNGAAVGMGATMTLAADVRLASRNARFGFVFARRGIVPESCSTWFLPRIVGVSQAAEWIYTGRIFGSDEALASGLVRSVHAPEDLLPAAYELAREIADNTSAVSVALSRQMLWRMLGADHPMEAHKLESRGVETLGKLPDAAEGVLSFLEKRSADFTGKPSADMPAFYPWWKEPEFS